MASLGSRGSWEALGGSTSFYRFVLSFHAACFWNLSSVDVCQRVLPSQSCYTGHQAFQTLLQRHVSAMCLGPFRLRPAPALVFPVQVRVEERKAALPFRHRQVSGVQKKR